MATNKNVRSGDYIYNLVFPLVDYCGDIRKDAVKYHPQFSPNNIKRLIISPDCVTVHYHVPIPTGERVKSVRIPAAMLSDMTTHPNYIPIMNVLCLKRICSSVEEVILLTCSEDGQHSLSGRELAFESLIITYNTHKSSLEEAIKSRYKRLRAFSIVDMTYSQFDRNLKACKGTDFNFITDLPFMSSQNIRYIHDEEEWYKSWGSAGQTYEMDKVGGVLHNHFTEFAKKMTEQSKRNAIDSSTKERNKSLEKEVSDLFNRYKAVNSMQNRLFKIVQSYGFNKLQCVEFNWVSPVKLYKCSVTEKYVNLMDATSESAALKENVTLLKTAFNSVVESLVTNFLNATAHLSKYHPLTAEILLRGVDCSILVPKSCISQVYDISKATGVVIEGKEIKSSVINACWLICRCYISRTSDKFDTKCLDRDFWKEALQ